jgi:hypothetical protein
MAQARLAVYPPPLDTLLLVHDAAVKLAEFANEAKPDVDNPNAKGS